MCGKSLAGAPAAEVRVALGFERQRIHQQRRAVFFKRKQFAGMHDNVGICSAADSAFNGWVVSERIAISPEQRLASGAFQLKFIGARKALLEIDLAITESKQRNETIAIEELVVVEE